MVTWRKGVRRAARAEVLLDSVRLWADRNLFVCKIISISLILSDLSLDNLSVRYDTYLPLGKMIWGWWGVMLCITNADWLDILLVLSGQYHTSRVGPSGYTGYCNMICPPLHFRGVHHASWLLGFGVHHGSIFTYRTVRPQFDYYCCVSVFNIHPLH